MKSILVANSKGGCGKTTIATSLAGAFADAGNNVLLADADRQGSSLAWTKSRPAHLAPIQSADWSKRIGTIPKGLHYLIIDGPAGIRETQVEALLDTVDIIVMPVLPSVFDQNASQEFLSKLDELKPIRRNKKPIAIVGNRVRAYTRAAQRLDEFLAELGHDVLTRLRESSFYPEAAARGMTIFDMGDMRSELVREDWDPLISFIEDRK
ncbi:ParA family protein [Roseiterribacter gracilis]|uniref:Chromosome partitioning protein ParA n=1 Tax=Roseiterribacter gracilis TaxID=2812848 RepID=A0A8S8XFV7_9PROT|nr:chromosome partitioning protein ParA [Rhodospirillales bacterium TMPK1]